MREPRYYVSTYSGWNLNPVQLQAGGRLRARPFSFCVHDRLIGHRLVREIPPQSRWAEGGSLAPTEWRRRKAYALAAELNARYEAWLAESPERLARAI